MSTELAIIKPDAFDVAWPGQARRAEALTRIWISRQRSPNTQAAYERDIKGWLSYCARIGVEPADIRLAHVDVWIVSQLEHGDVPSTISRRVSAVSSWYKYMIANTADDPLPLAVRNPTVGCSKPDVDQDFSPTVALSHAEADRFIAAADAHSRTASALIRLLLINGLRIGSVISAQVDDLGFDRGHRTLSLIRKGGHRDRVAIPPAVGEAIDAMLAERGNPATGHLFLTRRGKPLYVGWVFRLVKLLGRRAGVPQAEQLSAHSLRATAITELLDSGASLRDAQDFARHADPRTTRRYDKRRGDLDRAGSYILAARYGQRTED